MSTWKKFSQFPGRRKFGNCTSFQVPKFDAQPHLDKLAVDLVRQNRTGMFPITKMQQEEPEELNDSANKCYIVAPIQMLRAIPDYSDIIDEEFQEIFRRAGRDASGDFNAEWGDEAVHLINGIRGGTGEVIGITEQFDPAVVFQAVTAVMPQAVLEKHMGLQLGSRIRCDGCGYNSKNELGRF